MIETPTMGRRTLIVLAIVALIGLSGCIDASGLEGMDSSSAGAPNLQIADDEATADTPDGSTPTGANSDNEAEGETDAGTSALPETTATTITAEEASGAGAEDESNVEDESTGSATSSTSDDTTTDASEPEGPQRGDATSDESTQIQSHDIKDYPDGNANVGGTLVNPTDQHLDLVRVTVVLYDDSGAELGEDTTSISDLEPGGSATYAIAFDDVDYLDVDRYEVESAAVESQAETPSAASSETTTAAPTATTTATPDDTSQELPEPEGPQLGEVSSDESTHVISHDIKDYPDGQASVGGTLVNPTDEDLEHVHATVRLYDEADAEIGHETVCLLDVPAGESSGYSVTFPEVDYLDVDRYEVETFVGDD